MLAICVAFNFVCNS